MAEQNYLIVEDLDLDKYSSVLTTVAGFVMKFKQLFPMFTKIPLVLDEDWKGAVIKATGQANRQDNQLPENYAWIKISSCGAIPPGEAHNVKRNMTVGTGYNIDGDFSNATIKQAFRVWGRVNVEINFGIKSPVVYFAFCEKLSLCIASGLLNLDAEVDGFEYNIIVDQSAAEISTGQLTKDGDNAGWIQMPQSLTLKTQFGMTKDVPKINNEGYVQVNQSIGEEST